ncbi:hypothetical protein CR513_20368, partial [Mucuna pruriens]
MDRNMVDAASGGALMDKTPTTARHLISNMAIRGQGRSRHLKNSEQEIGKLGDRAHISCEAAR